jgi:hypothetical protein
LTGKRRGEAAILPLGNVKTEDNFLKITFILEKKRKENVLQKLATKSIPLSDPLTKPVVQYLDYLNRQEPKPKWFLPQAVSVFGNVTAINAEAHVSGRQVFNIARGCSKSVWPHLFRETVASDIIREDSSIIAAFKVQRRLDLEDFRTGFRYLKRFAEDVILKQEQQTVNGFRQT